MIILEKSWAQVKGGYDKIGAGFERLAFMNDKMPVNKMQGGGRL